VDSLWQVYQKEKKDFDKTCNLILRIHHKNEEAFDNFRNIPITPFKESYFSALESLLKEPTVLSEKGILDSVQFAKAHYIYLQEDYHKTIEYSRFLLKEPHFTGTLLRAKLYLMLSDALYRLERYDEALRLLWERKATFEKLNSEEWNRRNMVNQASALMYHKMKNYPMARSLYLKGIQELKGVSDFFSVASLYNNIGLTYEREHKKDSAILYYDLAIEQIKETIKNVPLYEGPRGYREHFLNVVESNRAVLDIGNGEMQEIIKALKKEIASSQRVREYHIYISAYNQLGRISFLQGDYKKSLEYLDKALQKIKEKRSARAHITNLKWRSRVLLKLDKIDQANLLYQQIAKIEDSLEIAGSIRRTEIATVRFETHKKERALEQHKLALVEKEIQIAKKNQYQYILVASSIILFLLLLSAYLFLRKEKLQKEIVEKTLDEKNLMLKEIHHRVKNNLQIISSILKVQGVKSNEPNFKQMMQDGQDRIKAMALIHEKLYQTDDFKNIDFRKYTQELIKSIKVSNGHFGVEKVEIIMEIPAIQFHIDTAIPIGLILNELISNCYKYAFPNNRKGSIYIGINNSLDGFNEIVVKDNGVGFSKKPSEKEKNTSFGLKMVEGLVWQLNGKVDISSNENGTSVKIYFKNKYSKKAV
jgi:two-component sensor histidine kinase